MAQIQHYVPQFILKNFSEGKKHHVWVFDKVTGKKFKTNVKNIASERGFYDLNLEKNVVTLEPSITGLENRASKIIKNILQNENISAISENDKLLLSQFFSVQLVRTKQYRIKFKHLSDTLEEKFRLMGFNPDHIKGYEKIDEEKAKFESLNSILQSDKFIPYFFVKPWLLFKTTKNCPLYTSDNPLTLQNLNDYGPYGNLGLAIKGIEIYFPVSKTITLAMYCDSIIDKIKNTFESLKNLSRLTPGSIIKVPLLLEQFITGIEKGTTIPYNLDSVINHNSLQVQFSARYIFSSISDFSLAEKMISENPELKDGPKIQIS
jgi:hypothetical protein